MGINQSETDLVRHVLFLHLSGPGRPVVTGIAQRMPPRAVGRGWRILGAGLLVLPAAGLPSCGAAHDSRSSHDRAILWHEDFAGGAVRWSDWTRCEQPWNDRVSACSNLAAGSGEQIYWDPALMRGGRDPVAPGADGGISLLARPITADERDLMVKATARQRDLQPAHRQALAQVGWTTAWMQTRTAYPTGTTIAARLRPGAGASFWGGFWTLNETAHGHGHWPPEIDIAEVTNEPDGRMRVRQVIHFRDAAGKLQTAGCPQALLPRDWITASVTRQPHELRFGLNGAEHCRIPVPPGFDDPMTIIFSEQVGGLAAHTTPATAPFALDVAWVRVARP